MHVFPDLKRLEGKYARELTVVGIHSGKFPGEKSTDGIREAAARYGIEHPVANDADFVIWRSYGVRAWPTLVLLDTEGFVVGQVSGEGHHAVLDAAIGKVVAAAEAAGTLDRRPLPFLRPPRAPKDPAGLSFPGKIAAGGDPARLYVADSNHHRIVVADPSGTVTDVIGSGEPEVRDGTFTAAAFRWPQGLALDGAALWVADTEGHSLRRVDLRARTVATVAGTGRQEFRRGWFRGPGRETPLNSPWDVAVDGPVIHVAMAGDHRLWTFDTRDGSVGPLAGTGRENIDDGPLREATFSQPSGLALWHRRLYVADCEDSAVRVVDLERGLVSTVVGTGLFDFGDRDGRGDAVRLQHPLAVVRHGSRLLLADTYNHRLKTLDPATREVRAFAGGGGRGAEDGPAERASFHEPSGLALLGDRLYVADTNNHAVRVVDVATGAVSTLVLRFPGVPPAPPGGEGGHSTPPPGPPRK